MVFDRLGMRVREIGKLVRQCEENRNGVWVGGHNIIGASIHKLRDLSPAIPKALVRLQNHAVLLFCKWLLDLVGWGL